MSSSPFHEFLARQIYLSITDSTRQIHSEVLLPISLLCCSINTLCCTYPLCELCIYNRRSDPTDESMSNPDPFQELVDNLRRVLVSSPSTTTSSAPFITSSMARPTWYSTNLLSCLQRCVLLSPPSCLLQRIYQSPSDVWAPFHKFLARQIYLSITDLSRQIHSEVLLTISLLCCSINTLCCTYPLCELCICNTYGVFVYCFFFFRFFFFQWNTWYIAEKHYNTVMPPWLRSMAAENSALPSPE